jgi:hypothetical protein
MDGSRPDSVDQRSSSTERQTPQSARPSASDLFNPANFLGQLELFCAILIAVTRAVAVVTCHVNMGDEGSLVTLATAGLEMCNSQCESRGRNGGGAFQ